MNNSGSLPELKPVSFSGTRAYRKITIEGVGSWENISISGVLFKQKTITLSYVITSSYL